MNKRERIKQLERDLLTTLDQYAEVAAALGFEADMFGDSLASHEEIVNRAKQAQHAWSQWHELPASLDPSAKE